MSLLDFSFHLLLQPPYTYVTVCSPPPFAANAA